MAINGQPLSDGESEHSSASKSACESYSCLPEEDPFGNGIAQESLEFTSDFISDFNSDAPQMSKSARRGCMKRKRSRKLVLNRLLRQLQSLRSAGPCSARLSKACAIQDALSYSSKLWREIHDLRNGLSVIASEKADHRFPAKSKVEVVADDSGVRVHVSCEKLPGLTVVLMQALERSGLIFHNVNLSCHNNVVLNAVGVPARFHPRFIYSLQRSVFVVRVFLPFTAGCIKFVVPVDLPVSCCNQSIAQNVFSAALFVPLHHRQALYSPSLHNSATSLIPVHTSAITA